MKNLKAWLPRINFKMSTNRLREKFQVLFFSFLPFIYFTCFLHKFLCVCVLRGGGGECLCVWICVGGGFVCMDVCGVGCLWGCICVLLYMNAYVCICGGLGECVCVWFTLVCVGGGDVEGWLGVCARLTGNCKHACGTCLTQWFLTHVDVHMIDLWLQEIDIEGVGEICFTQFTTLYHMLVHTQQVSSILHLYMQHFYIVK